MTTFLDQTRDPQSLGKPTGFSGNDEDWQTWSIKFESWCGLQGLEASMEAAAAMSSEIILSSLGTSAMTQARQLYHILITLCEGKALSEVMMAEKYNGLEAWRKLKNLYEPDVGSRWVSMLKGILNPDWSDPKDKDKDFMEVLNEWEKAISRYELGR